MRFKIERAGKIVTKFNSHFPLYKMRDARFRSFNMEFLQHRN
jgi:hypothetical protein